MKNLKKIDIVTIGDFEYEDTITISVNGIKEEYTPDEVLGVVNKLSQLQADLTKKLVSNRIKEINQKEY